MEEEKAQSQYFLCSLHQVKHVANEYIKQNPEHRQELIKFWPIVKEGLTVNELVDNDDNENHHEKQALLTRMKDLQNQANMNTRRIEEMLINISESVKNSKQLECKVNTTEMTPQEIGMLDESMEMLKEINKTSKYALAELQKINSVKKLGEDVRRDSVSLIPRDAMRQGDL